MHWTDTYLTCSCMRITIIIEFISADSVDRRLIVLVDSDMYYIGVIYSKCTWAVMSSYAMHITQSHVRGIYGSLPKSLTSKITVVHLLKSNTCTYIYIFGSQLKLHCLNAF